MASYSTEQRKLLMLYLRCHPDKYFSARQIAEALKEAGISQSAVYRNLALLEEEGFVSRTLKSGGRESVYQFVGADACQNCLHLTCVKCGSICHMEAKEIEALLPQTGFTLDRKKTVLYGVCLNCSENDM